MGTTPEEFAKRVTALVNLALGNEEASLVEALAPETAPDSISVQPFKATLSVNLSSELTFALRADVLADGTDEEAGVGAAVSAAGLLENLAQGIMRLGSQILVLTPEQLLEIEESLADGTAVIVKEGEDG